MVEEQFTEEEKKKLPKHVGIIMDGNGRWARSRKRPRLFGHRNGVENVRSVVNAAKEIGVPYITLYAFSSENQNRPEDEKSGLMKLLEEFLKRELNAMMKDGIRLRAIGNLAGLPEFAQRIVEETIEKTKGNQDWNLTLALNYGSRQEVLDAVHSYSQVSNQTLQSLTGKNLPNICKPKTCLTPISLFVHPVSSDSVTFFYFRLLMPKYLFLLFTGPTLTAKLLWKH